MDPIAKALSERGETLAEVAELLYGDGAWEFIAKRSSQEQRERTQARVGLASNAVGITAGTAGLASAMKDDRLETGGKVARGIYRAGKGIENTAMRTKAGRGYYTKIKNPKVAAGLAVGAVGLQAANLAGDAVANRVLARSAKKQPVAKGMLRQIRTTVKNAENASMHAERATRKAERLIPTRKQAALAGTGFVAATGAANYGATYAGTKRGVRAGLKPVDTTELQKNFDWDARIEISKVNEDKRQVFGWASVITKNGEAVVDLQNDFMAMETIEKAAYDYVKSSRKGGDMHRRNGAEPHHVSDMIESFVVTDEKKEKLGLPEDFPTGWLVGFQVNDEETWKLVKDGKRTQFSIHGSGQRVEKVLD